MKKIILTLLLLGIKILLYGQSLNSNTYWIATHTYPLKEGVFVPNQNGLIFNFRENEVFTSSLFFELSQSFSLKIEEKQIFIQDTLWSTIEHYSSDSLIVNIDDTMRVKFIPVRSENKIDVGMDLIERRDWLLSVCDTKWTDCYSIRKIGFTDEPWNRFPKEIAKICVIQSVAEGHKSTDLESWNYKIINNTPILAIGQFTDHIFFIQDYKGDTAFLTDVVNENAEAKLTSITVIDKQQRVAIIQNLQNTKWSTNKVIDYGNSFEEIKKDVVEHVKFLGKPKSTAILPRKSSLLRNKLAYYFADDFTYRIYEADKLISTGKWDLSLSGKQIVLNKGFETEDYIDIFLAEPQKLIIGKTAQFLVGKDKFVEYYFKLELIK